MNNDMRMLREYYLRKTYSLMRLWARYVDEQDHSFLDSLDLPESAQDHAGILKL